MNCLHVALDYSIRLGESIVWDDREQVLYWVNIHDREVRSWNPDGVAALIVLSLPERVGALGLRESGGLVLALESSFALLDLETRRRELMDAAESDLPTTRFADGRIDPGCRFDCGGMDEATPQRPISAIHSLAADHYTRRLFDGVFCTNSLCWSQDGGTMYFTDMPTRRIDAFDYEVITGQAANRRVFTDRASEPGWADGSIVDAEGCLWNAQRNGSRLIRYRPGTMEHEVELPVSNPTSMAIGGADLDVLKVATAWFGLSERQRAQEPHTDSSFAFWPGVRGQLECCYAR